MAELQQDEVAFLLGRALVSIVAPKEEPYYDEVIRALPNKSPKERDRFLASGLHATDIWAMTVSAYILSKPLLDFLWAHVKGPAGNLVSKTAESTQRKISEWIDHKMAGPAPITIDDISAAKFSSEISSQAPALGVSPENAKIICDALLQKLRSSK